MKDLTTPPRGADDSGNHRQPEHRSPASAREQETPPRTSRAFDKQTTTRNARSHFSQSLSGQSQSQSQSFQTSQPQPTSNSRPFRNHPSSVRQSFTFTSGTSLPPTGIAALTEENLRALGASPLTKENLQILEATEDLHIDPRSRGSNHRQDFKSKRAESPTSGQDYMRKKGSPKKSDRKRTKEEQNTHPLNLPPDELRRLSAAMSRAENGTQPMDVDHATQENGTSTNGQPPSPSKEAPGAFPDSVNGSETPNGVNGHEEKSPTPPPHKPQVVKVDAEACKAAGNKFFKAKDYERAIVEYTKGMLSLLIEADSC